MKTTITIDIWRNIHECACGPHYDEEFAKNDVATMHCTDKAGEQHNGEYWSKNEVVAATEAKVFPEGTTDWDKYVAYNAAHNDLCSIMDDSDILNVAYELYFNDEDAPDGKIWRYMTAMNGSI